MSQHTEAIEMIHAPTVHPVQEMVIDARTKMLLYCSVNLRAIVAVYNPVDNPNRLSKNQIRKSVMLDPRLSAAKMFFQHKN